MKNEAIKCNFSYLVFRNSHLIKAIDCHICLEILNVTMKEKFVRVSKYCSIQVCSNDFWDIFSKGLNLILRYKNQLINNPLQLSGGEKTLSSLCLILSTQFFSQMKFYMFDEIDSALDFKNIKRISFEMKYQTKKSQNLLISLRNNMVLNVNHVIGIFKIKNKTKIICLRI